MRSKTLYEAAKVTVYEIRVNSNISVAEDIFLGYTMKKNAYLYKKRKSQHYEKKEFFGYYVRSGK